MIEFVEKTHTKADPIPMMASPFGKCLPFKVQPRGYHTYCNLLFTLSLSSNVILYSNESFFLSIHLFTLISTYVKKRTNRTCTFTNYEHRNNAVRCAWLVSRFIWLFSHGCCLTCCHWWSARQSYHYHFYWIVYCEQNENRLGIY